MYIWLYMLENYIYSLITIKSRILMKISINQSSVSNYKQLASEAPQPHILPTWLFSYTSLPLAQQEYQLALNQTPRHPNIKRG